MKIFWFPLIFSLSAIATAAPKQLVCENNGDINNWATQHPALYEKMCKEFQDDDCDRAEQRRREVKVCLSKGIDWSHRLFITFNTDDLNGGNAEHSALSCWDSEPQETSKATISSTPNIISFQVVIVESLPPSVFNVDRKTLRAGWDADRTFNCKLNDIDVSEYKL